MLLDVDRISVFYDKVQALDTVSLTVAEGEIVALIGPNGAGKSTSLKAIAGILNPQSGTISFLDETINGLHPYQLVSKGLCLVPEDRHVFSTMTVLENLEMGAFALSDQVIFRDRISKIYDLFPRLKERRFQKAGTLSSGEQQMLAIGRALMLDPKLLMLDEPSVGLSPNFIEDVFEKLKEINKSGITVLLVEQNAKMALEYAEKAYVFGIGKIALSGPSFELKKDERIQKAYLSG